MRFLLASLTVLTVALSVQAATPKRISCSYGDYYLNLETTGPGAKSVHYGICEFNDCSGPLNDVANVAAASMNGNETVYNTTGTPAQSLDIKFAGTGEVTEIDQQQDGTTIRYFGNCN